MAFRAPVTRLSGRVASRAAVPRHAPVIARFYSQAAAAPTSTMGEKVRSNFERDATLPCPDPAADSASAALVKEHAPFMVATYSRPPPVFVKGEGSYIWDIENRRYLDLTAGIAVNALGHSDPEFCKLIAQQAETLVHASNLYYNPWTGALSKLLVEKTLEAGCMHDATAVFVCNSGSEANEAGIKFARKVGKTIDPTGEKHEFVSFHGAFHGRTMGSLSATPNSKYQAPFSPMVPGFKYGTYNDVEGIKDLVTEKTCGVLVEPIQGEGGVNVASDEFLIALGKRCREVGAVLQYDEIQCGLSRTGDLWAHGRLPPEAHPDILTTAKALGNGFPIGATIVNKHVAEKIKVGDHGTTFGGNPLACRLAHYIVSRLADPAFQKDVVAKGAVFVKGFEQLRNKYPSLITEVRGRGLILGLQLTEDPAPIITAARERGLLVITAGANTLRFVPSLTISEQEIQEGLDILDEAIRTTRA
ncbi:acetylornithine and succinylornithine aminotransferase [Phialemonium atrogriseum]|uniref:acetylornithine transaminase n=1 Tax=Phialemonium atrogriseum TaxID=1093897 RepID=A0AAJ0FLZ1_9PEZI|nr:acetylornithine and succinylornithine aminotransferase [Phialemonium atrogriseum]KAK1772722.1 acetylornithine and succinylornithine aminotransferase [Phialemonium atrogriseum]